MTSIDIARREESSARPTATLGTHLAGQLERLCDAVGLPGDVRALHDLLGSAGTRLLAEPPPSASFVSDDHTPAELSVTFPGGGDPTVRVLVEPGCAATTPAANGRMGVRVLDYLTERWGVSVEPFRRIEDLFLPSAPQGRFVFWCALELRRAAPPGIKVYLNPLAQGPERAAGIVGEALTRLGYGAAWPALLASAVRRTGDDELMFFSVDLGHWASPRVKVYVTQRGLSAEGAEEIARLVYRDRPLGVARFCRDAAGTAVFDRRPLVSCFTFTGGDAGRPSGYTVYVPVRDYVRDDQEARDRAAALLRRHSVPDVLLDRALAAMTSRGLADGVGLISYLSLVRADGRPSRLTVYLSPEAYRVSAPRERG